MSARVAGKTFSTLHEYMNVVGNSIHILKLKECRKSSVDPIKRKLAHVSRCVLHVGGAAYGAELPCGTLEPLSYREALGSPLALPSVLSCADES